ncbi:hypothetical protein [Porphyromonas sp. oral taxon 275]|uniref:hypothetical protein n=1 Tax=Porphyromonas sp. oral taxon 275 TaxID=712435 RepID=UPI001BA6F58E|nr:hypothetical protein [Porphyromonas sp. oral taxon 275]QUB42413.1 hypothetical protein J4862_05250 [Porphyromonas sp. oral taxon 275]
MTSQGQLLMKGDKRSLKKLLIEQLVDLIEAELKAKISTQLGRNEVSFRLQEDAIEVLRMRFLTGTHVPMGAALAFIFHISVTQGRIGSLLRSLLDEGNKLQSVYTEHSSNLTRRAAFRNYGIVCLYPGEDARSLAQLLLPPLVRDFISPALALLREEEVVLSQVVAKPSAYAYPLATILILLWLQGRLDDYEQLLSAYPDFKPSDRGLVQRHQVLEQLRSLTRLEELLADKPHDDTALVQIES